MPVSEEQARRGRRRKILVVDDDVDQRVALAQLLSCAGYDVVLACDGQDAVELLGGGLQPSLIVLDLNMPRMDGWAFLDHLRSVRHSAVAVLVVSAGATEHPPAGCDECLEKPLDASRIGAIVARLCAGEHARAEPSH